MFGQRFTKGTAVALALLAIATPEVRVLADAQQLKLPAAGSRLSNRIPDLRLTSDGTVTGRVCDHTGHVLPGMTVELKRANKTISTTTTNKDGVYSFSNVKGGVYYMSCGNTEGLFRVWSEKTAPPTAKEYGLLVLGENGARGQYGAMSAYNILLTAGVIGAIGASAYSINQTDNLRKRVNQIPTSP